MWFDRLFITTTSPFEGVGAERFATPFIEGCRVQGLSKGLLRDEAGTAQTGDQRDGSFRWENASVKF